MERKEAKRMDRFVQFLRCSEPDGDRGFQACEIVPDNADRIGVLIGSGNRRKRHVGRSSIRLSSRRGPKRVSPFFVPMLISDMAAGMVSIIFGAKGRTLGDRHGLRNRHTCHWRSRQDHRNRGDADVMIAGGAEAAITPMSVAGFCAARAFSTRNDDPAHASRPFDLNRDGFGNG